MINILQYGVGAIGSEIAKLVLQRDGLNLIGALDLDESKIGRDLGDVIGIGRKLGIEITDNLQEILSIEPDLVLHSTSSRLDEIIPQIEEILAGGVDVISTAEELAYPYLKQPEKSEKIDQLAKNKGATVLGTGVNPGFIMDLLPLIATGPCHEVNKIKVERIVDATKRRKPLQEKIGVGLTKEEFDQKVAAGGGHVGLLESVALIADGLGWNLDDLEEEIEPVITDSKKQADAVQVEKGKVIGLKQVGKGIINGNTVITLNLQMYLDADPKDRIMISGTPDLLVSFEGGLHGDIATPAVVVNSIPQVLKANPGLLTVLDLPIPSAWVKL